MAIPLFPSPKVCVSCPFTAAKIYSPLLPTILTMPADSCSAASCMLCNPKSSTSLFDESTRYMEVGSLCVTTAILLIIGLSDRSFLPDINANISI